MGFIQNSEEGEEVVAMNGNVGATEAATLALLTDTARAGRGYFGGEGGIGGFMYPGNSMLAANAHADGSAVKEGIDCGQRMFDAGLNRVSDQAEESRRSAQFTTLVDGQFRSELRTNDRLNAMSSQSSQNMLQLTRDINDSRAEAAKAACEALLCCKDTQCLVKEEAGATRQLILETALKTATDLNNVNATIGPINAAAAANTAAIVAAIQSLNHHHRG